MYPYGDREEHTLTCGEALLGEGQPAARLPVRQKAETAGQEQLRPSGAVVGGVLQPDARRKFIARRRGVGGHGAGVGAAVHLDAKADGAGVVAVRQEPHAARHRPRAQLLAATPMMTMQRC